MMICVVGDVVFTGLRVVVAVLVQVLVVRLAPVVKAVAVRPFYHS